MAREFSRAFYHTKAWKHTREAYVRSVNGLCERCLEQGKYTKGEIVHHIEHLSPANIDNPAVTLGFDNLQLVCRDCHAELHPEIFSREESDARCAFDEQGNVLPRTEDL